MSTDYTDPSTIDVDVVIGNINHAHRVRGHLWTDERSWPNVTVKALADEVERLRAALEDARDDLAAVESARREETDEYDACANIAKAMASAVGWETPGENWVEKAAHLAPLAAELEAARDARAAAPASEDDGSCEFCHGLGTVRATVHPGSDPCPFCKGTSRRVAGSPPPTPAPTRMALADAVGRVLTDLHDDDAGAERIADAVMSLLPEPSKKPARPPTENHRPHPVDGE
jgi:hypothetical protein